MKITRGWGLLMVGAMGCRQGPPTQGPSKTEASAAVTPRPAASAVVASALPATAPNPRAVRGQQDCPPDMLFVPGATFSVIGPVPGGADNTPQKQQLHADAFCIDRTELPMAKYDPKLCGKLDPDCSQNASRQGPATGVSYDQAECMCARGTPGTTKRLPSDPEWLLAALGTDGRRFPWGNDPYPDGYKVGQNFCPDQANVPVNRWICPVEVSVLDKSPFGVIGMASNANEITSTCFPSPDRRFVWCAVRGADVNFGPLEVTGQVVRVSGPNGCNAGLSFRCVISDRAQR